MAGFRTWAKFRTGRRAYHPPREHPRISQAERELILVDAQDRDVKAVRARPRWRDLLRLPQTWGTIVAKGLTDPVWFFVTDWFPIYLVAKGIPLKSGLLAVWVPFIASDLGNFFGGAASGYLIRRGWPLAAARKALVVFGGFGVLALIPTIVVVDLWAITNVLPADLFASESVASVSGFGGTAAGIGTIIAFKLIGYLTDARQAMATHSFDPIVVVAGLVPFVGMILVLLLVRNTRATTEGLVRRI